MRQTGAGPCPTCIKTGNVLATRILIYVTSALACARTHLLLGVFARGPVDQPRALEVVPVFPSAWTRSLLRRDPAAALRSQTSSVCERISGTPQSRGGGLEPELGRIFQVLCGFPASVSLSQNNQFGHLLSSSRM